MLTLPEISMQRAIGVGGEKIAGGDKHQTAKSAVADESLRNGERNGKSWRQTAVLTRWLAAQRGANNSKQRGARGALGEETWHRIKQRR